MALLHILFGTFKFTLFLAFAALIGGRIFFPLEMEEMVIKPSKNLPVFGQVLGVTWDSTGTIGPVLTQKTVDMADKIEKSNLPINETISSLATSDDPTKAANELVEKKVEEKINKIQDLPAEAVEQLKEEVRKEMYRQICQDWLGGDTPTDQE